MNEGISNSTYDGRTVYLFSDSATLTDPYLYNISLKSKVRIINSDGFEGLDNHSLILVAFRNLRSFDMMEKNEKVMSNYMNSNVNKTRVVFYGSLRLVEKDTVTPNVWYNSATISFLFVVLIFLVLIWFLMHFMLGVQSIGPAVFAKPKTD